MQELLPSMFNTHDKVSSCMPMTDYQHDIDALGLYCPLPLLRLKKALVSVESGEIIRLRATDPAAHLDIGVFAEKTGHLIVESYTEDNIQYFFIRKK